MHLVRINLGGVPPFTEPIRLKFDEQVNVLIGPNASGKSTILLMLANCLNGPEEDAKRPISPPWKPGLRLHLHHDDSFDRYVDENSQRGELWNILTASEDWTGSRSERKPRSEWENPPVIDVGSVREGLPGISNQEPSDTYGGTAAKALAGPFSGSRTMCVFELLRRELYPANDDGAPRMERGTLIRAMELSDACSKRICDEVITDSISRNYIADPWALGYMNHPLGDLNNIKVLRWMGTNTTDVRNYDSLPDQEQPSASAYADYNEPLPIYLGHLSSGTEGTLLWIRWLALKMVHHYKFDGDWHKKPAILLIDEIENHLHPTWQRRVIPALLEHFPGLQIFATTHSPFVVAGLKAGQVHLLNRDANGVVTATTNAEDVIGWTADEILRTMMGVDDPTDLLTIERDKRLRELRGKETLTDEEESELNTLRRQVNEAHLSRSGPVDAQRENYAELMQRFLLTRQSDLSQDGG